jgi:hypothetical protein
MPWYLVLLSSAFVESPVVSGGSDIMPGMRMLSFWNNERFATSRRLNGVGES